MAAEPTTTRRLDESLTTKAQTLLKSLLDTFPDLRSVAVVFDYHIEDAGSLPAGTWLPRGPLKPREVLSLCKAVDKVSFSLREQHDDAVMKHVTKALQTEKKDGE